MTISVSKTGPYFSSGPISFSELRKNFKLSNSGMIKASELRRNTNVNDPNPIVPDATENSNISTQLNLSLSQFRNSIKYYDIIQSGTDEDTSFQLSSYWNGNSNKNIVKKVYITGTMGDSTSDSASCRYRGDLVTTYNLSIIISGSIYGLAGRGGGQSGSDGLNGTAGGSALRVEGSGSGTTQTINVSVLSGGRVWAGGGGGERGANGAKGEDGICRLNTIVSGCGGAPGCPSGYTESSTWGGGCCQTYSYCCGLFNCACTACSQYQKYRSCYKDYTVAGGEGGIGGLGANGRGWDNFTASLTGESGTPGQPPASGTSSSSNYSYNWTTDSNNAYLNVSGSGGQDYCKITIQVVTDDNPNDEGTSYSSINLKSGGAILNTWNFPSDGTSKQSYTFNASAKTYRLQVNGNPRNVTKDGNTIKLRDSGGDDANATIKVTSLKQTSVSSNTCEGAQTIKEAQPGQDGEKGGDGGDWGSPGDDTSNTGSGGPPGYAIFGKNFTITGKNSSTVKGIVEYNFVGV